MKKRIKNKKPKKVLPKEEEKPKKVKTNPFLKKKKRRKLEENLDDLAEYEDHLLTEEDFEEELESNLKKR